MIWKDTITMLDKVSVLTLGDTDKSGFLKSEKYYHCNYLG